MQEARSIIVLAVERVTLMLGNFDSYICLYISNFGLHLIERVIINNLALDMIVSRLLG